MTGIILLAAGASTRMGKPKQRLIFEGETLLQRAVRMAEAANAISVIIVLGADATTDINQENNKQLSLCHNEHWQEGMASSIRAGLHQLTASHPTIENVLFMLCDQPFVTTALLNRLIEIQQQQQAGIVACTYQDTIGAPVSFNCKYFNDLLALTGQEGAKKLLMKFSENVITVPFEQGRIDIDTPEDFERLKSVDS